MPAPKQTTDPPCGTLAVSAGAWWDRLFNASDDAQFICKGDGVIEQLNPKALHFLGIRTAEEGIGNSILPIFAVETRKRVLSLLSSTRKVQETIP